MTSNRHSITGFWSYSRALEEVGGSDLHRQMQHCLTDKFAPLPFELWRDRDPEGGIRSGLSWPREIVSAISRSILFFWIQSPRWLDREVCRLEFEAFRDRARRIAQAFPVGVNPDDLWGRLMTPVHLLSLHDDAWQFFPAAIRDSYQALWVETQRHPKLDLSLLSRSRDPLSVDTRALCMATASDIYDDLVAAAAALGTTLPKLLECAALPDPAFEQYWLSAFYDRGILKRSGGIDVALGSAPDPERLLARQRRLAERHSGGRTRRHVGQLQLEMLLLPSRAEDDGFWCSTDSAEGIVAAAAAAREAMVQPSRDAAGYTLWSEPAVMAVLPELARFRLKVPDSMQAGVLRQALATDKTTGRLLGFATQPGSFWTRDGYGPLNASTVAGPVSGDRHPLFLVSALS